MKNNNTNLDITKLQINLDYNKVKTSTTNQDVTSITFLSSLLKCKNRDVLNTIEIMIKSEKDTLERKRLNNIFTVSNNYKKVNLSLEYSNMYFGTIEKVSKYLSMIEDRELQKSEKKKFNEVVKSETKSIYNKAILELLPKKEKSSSDIYNNIIKEIDLISDNDLNKLYELIKNKIA